MTKAEALKIVIESASFRADQWAEASRGNFDGGEEFHEADSSECLSIATLTRNAIKVLES